MSTTILSGKDSLISEFQKFLFWFCFCLLSTNNAGGQSLIEKGKYIFHASGGCSCHTDTKNDGEFLAGGRPIKTPFG
ncbi:MAG: hypothetical protein QF711_07200, partial [SAR324 cluster bacterium]|nr:hypothetical protein [SAR324 cluster bacterium]